MELVDILIGQSEAGIPQAEYDGQPLQERVHLLPDAPEDGESADDLATRLTASQGLALAQDYFVSGNLAESARKLRVRYPVALRTSHEGWFQEELVALEHQLKIRQKARLDGLLDKTLSQLESRLQHGDEVMTKDGIANVSVKARDLAAIAAILTERREKLDDATKPAAGAPKGKLESLAEKMRAVAAAGASNAVVIEPKQVSHGS
jgi:hypothetical protein